MSAKEKGDNLSVTESSSDAEGKRKIHKYPRAIPFIIGNEFCERFNFYGMRTILVLYLTIILHFDNDTATVIYHTFTMMVYLMCIFGAIIADSWLGKFKTIFFLSIVYVIGSVVISLGAIPDLHLPGTEMTIIGLVLIALGSGGIKPCVAAFGGDQFILPEQAKAMATFFSLFYFSINSGSLISTTVTPILREDVTCFGQDSCFSLAFGVPAVLMAVSIVVFVMGRWLYINKPPSGNMFLLVTKAIGNAIGTRCKDRKTNPQDHWLEYAVPKYGKQLVEDIKVLLRVLVLYIPLPIFWALFDQQGSRWTFQATRMDGQVGVMEVKPDQMQMLNPLLILLFIPLFDFAIYPVLHKVGVRRPLQKLAIGGILAGIAFVVSGVVETQLEETYPVLPTDENPQLRFFNGIPKCPMTLHTDIPNHKEIELPYLEFVSFRDIDVSKATYFNYTMTSTNKDCKTYNGSFDVYKGEATSYFFKAAEKIEYQDDPSKPKKTNPYIRVLADIDATHKMVVLRDTKDNVIRYRQNGDYHKLEELGSSRYVVSVGENDPISEITLRPGGVYALIVIEKGTNRDAQLLEITPPNSMSIMWLVPQYVIMTMGEVMFSVTGLEFSYEQAPVSMKSVLQACWQLTVALGNLVVVIVAEVRIFKSQAYEFFLFAGLMFVDMLLFMYLAYRYKPNAHENHAEEIQEAEPKNGILNVALQTD